jgi:hypothetical protein
MMEGNWITMPGVPLITVGGPEAAAREEGEVTGAPGDEAGAAEDTTAPTTEEERADGCNTRKFHDNKILLATWPSFIFLRI